ncbi:uncharacterized protein LOC118734809 [Rhagoletis pomonella]|uniref:uncharacterized protein LOC118734809 n=1 Tax=Rhagoletis pomonella TaxID=28610 RepID=UPI001786CE85|nr:uncharacterized protein LOC118734809 [Rhagoletis pomonella]
MLATGNKAHKVATLMEALGSDEIDASEVEQEDPWERPINELKDMITELARSMQMLSAERATAEPASMPQRVETTQESSSRSTTQQASTYKIQDIVGILPEFDPLKKLVTAQQFVTKAEQLQRTYLWNDNLLLFAAQQKLVGIAKNWLDAQPVFQSWTDFVSMLLKDFPCIVNSAEIHRELGRRKRKPTETFIEYYYAMMTLGRRGKLDDASINFYTINGINDMQTTRTLLAMNLITSNELLHSLENLQTIQSPTTTQQNATTTVKTNAYTSSGGQPPRSLKCFNCNEYGHVAVKCPHPQKKQRCTKCTKVGHDAKDCRANMKPNVAEIGESKSTSQVPPIIQHVTIEGKLYDALVDTGSDHSLISEAVIPTTIQCAPAYKRFKGFGGSIVESTRRAEVKLQINNEYVNANLYVVPDHALGYDLLLGRDVLCGQNKRLVIDNGSLQLQVKSDTFKINDQLNDAQRTDIQTLLHEYQNCFAEDVSTLGRCNTTTMEIKVTIPGPIVGKRYQVPLSQERELTGILNNLLANEIIRPSTSPHAASALLVRKANGENRMCIDYRALNAVTVRKNFPMPVVEEQLFKLAGGKFYTTLDMTSGYYQIPMKESSKEYTAFLTQMDCSNTMSCRLVWSMHQCFSRK